MARRARSFGAAALSYELGRPGYPAAAVRWCLPEGAASVCDLGAGTGKLTRALLALDLAVVAVEPLEAMRALIPGPAEVVAGSAEAIPLPSESVDCVLAGQAYHWFDPDRALPEIARVLRPGGTFAALWNLLDDRVAWVGTVADAFDAEDRLSVLGALDDPPFSASPHFGEPESVAVSHDQPSDTESLLANVASRSNVALLDPQARERVLELVRRAAPAGSFPVPYVCTAWKATRR